MLELTDGQRERIRELRKLSEEAEGGDKAARSELRRALRESAPEVIARCSDTARVYRRMLAERSAGGDPLAQEAIAERACIMTLELAGDNPAPLEVLLSERVASLWVLTELQEAQLAAWYSKNGGGASPALVLQIVRLQESTHRRYLAAIRTLAQVQRLRAPQRLQVNIGAQQVNFS
jgi:hypothetical protein